MIRALENKDIEKILSLWLETSKEAHWFIESAYWDEMLIDIRQKYLPLAECFVFEDKHQIKGFISILGENYIGALFVNKKFQNKKIGQKLLDYVRRHRPHLNLNVYVKNIQALRFYQKNGFKIVCEQVDEDTNEQELKMSWARGCLSGYQKRHQGDS